MRDDLSIKKRLAFTTVVFCIFLAGCGDYEIALPNGYRLVRANAIELMILDPDGNFVILPKVDGYRVYGHIVVGHVSYVELVPEYEAESVPGYFFIDTRSRMLRSGLKEQAWLDMLHNAGITERPELKHPSWFHAVFG